MVVQIVFHLNDLVFGRTEGFLQMAIAISVAGLMVPGEGITTCRPLEGMNCCVVFGPALLMTTDPPCQSALPAITAEEKAQRGDRSGVVIVEAPDQALFVKNRNLWSLCTSAGQTAHHVFEGVLANTRDRCCSGQSVRLSVILATIEKAPKPIEIKDPRRPAPLVRRTCLGRQRRRGIQFRGREPRIRTW